jgi:dihydroorotase-like cyclic amidohydrolase
LRLFHADAINLWGIENESGSGFAPLQDIGISGDRITAIAAGLPDGGESLDVAGGLVSGGLIET